MGFQVCLDQHFSVLNDIPLVSEAQLSSLETTAEAHKRIIDGCAEGEGRNFAETAAYNRELLAQRSRFEARVRETWERAHPYNNHIWNTIYLPTYERMSDIFRSNSVFASREQIRIEARKTSIGTTVGFFGVGCFLGNVWAFEGESLIGFGTRRALIGTAVGGAIGFALGVGFSIIAYN